MRNASGVAGVLLVIWISRGISAATWYVDCSVFASCDGTSWETVLKRIQEGIDAASDGDTVTVAEGTYVENIHFKGKNIVLRSTDPLDPHIVAKTVIDGNQAGSVVTFCGTEDETCVLSGFTIRNGTAPSGGGIYGGMGVNPTRARIQNNIVTGNSAGLGGAFHKCAGMVRNNTISGNLATADGGGLSDCDGMVEDNIITGNSANVHGGGLAWCSGTIQGNLIAANSAAYAGGALAYGGPTLRNNVVSGNSAGKYGGGLFGSGGTIEGNVISVNSAGRSGGGLYQSGVTIRNNTIAGNSASETGGGLSVCSGAMVNCVTWANTAPTSPQLWECPDPTYSCIQGWTGGGKTNISADPRFVDAEGPDNDPATYEDNNYRLRADSPCIDAGWNEEWMWSAVDLDGNPRIFYGKSSLTVDMGAYEYGSWPFEIVQLGQVQGGGALLTWKSRPGGSYILWWRCDLIGGAWTREAATIPSGGDQTTWTDPNATFTSKFYRIEIE